MGERERKARVAREAARDEREIDELRPVKNPRRRKRAESSVESWAMTYLKGWFPLAISQAHRDAAGLLQTCMDEGGLGALAISRGFGKTTWTMAAVMRALLSGRRKFVVVVCATDKLAERLVKKIKHELETNDLLDEDYPEVTQPVRALERITRRAFGQVWPGGIPTRIEWNAGGLVLPMAYRKGKPTPSAGGIIHTVGITGAVKGINASGPNGDIIRPDVVILDDVQTRESAKSPTQTSDRETVITDDVLGLAGPNVAIATAMLITPMYQNDLAEKFLDSDRHPEWEGRRVPMLREMPEKMEMWEEYRDRRQDGQRAGDRGKDATEFYVANRATMDAGAVVTWPERFKPGEVSGLQSAMNIWCDNPKGFRSEYQCSPEASDLGVGAKELVPATIATRVTGVERGEVPRECSLLTAGFDAGNGLHWYAVVAWNGTFGGSIIDYGCWPRQARAFFAASDAKPKLKDHYPGFGDKEVVYHGLMDLTSHVLGRVYKGDETGGEMKISRALVDSGYESDSVYQFVRASPYSNVLMPSKGVARGRHSRGIMEWAPKPGERKGDFWRLTKAEKGRGQMAQFDPDFWKSVLYDRLTTPLGGPKTIGLFGKAKHVDHEMIAEHLAAEYSDTVTMRGLTFDSWQPRPDRNDNHLLDCVVMAAVAASVSGLVLSATADGRPVGVEKRAKVSLRKLQQQKRAERERRQLVGAR